MQKIINYLFDNATREQYFDEEVRKCLRHSRVSVFKYKSKIYPEKYDTKDFIKIHGKKIKSLKSECIEQFSKALEVCKNMDIWIDEALAKQYLKKCYSTFTGEKQYLLYEVIPSPLHFLLERDCIHTGNPTAEDLHQVQCFREKSKQSRSKFNKLVTMKVLFTGN